MKNISGEVHKLEFYLKVLRFISESTDDYFFVYDLDEGKLYFNGNIQDKYAIFQNDEEYCRLADWYNIVYEKDLPNLVENINELISGKTNIHNMEYRIHNKQGNRVWVSCRGKCLDDTEGKGKILIGRVSDTALTGKTDSLTGAFNMDRLTEDVSEIIKNKWKCYLLLIGVDNLKHINIKWGREYGNRILKEIAEILEDETDTTKVYRLNGDCFAVNLLDASKEEVEDVYCRLRNAVAAYCTISGGAVSYQESDVENPIIIYQFAEEALDRSKKRGKDVLSFFSASEFEKTLKSFELESELRESKKNNYEGFFLCYQPQIKLADYSLYGIEALLRYNSKKQGIIKPGDFIPILERTGMINEVGQWVLTNALAQSKKWRREIPDLHISVNISYAQLVNDDIAQSILDVVEKNGIPGNKLTLEVTESIELQDYSYFNKIFYQWKRYGIKLAIDDFGTGYCGLSHLKSLEVDEIKIDRCFISGIQHSGYNFQLLSNIIEFAKNSGIKVCCEGVETKEELNVLKELNPDTVQGFFFSVPYTQEEFENQYITRRDNKFSESSLEKYEMDNRKALDKSLYFDDDLKSIMGALDELIYVSDPDTYELYYMNPAGQRLTGIYDYKGKKCYKVLQGLDEPCAYCTNKYLRREAFYTWEYKNEYLNRQFILKDKLVLWQDKVARMEYAIDITDQKIARQDKKEKLEFVQNIANFAQKLSGETDTKKIIYRVLTDIGHFYKADRAYFFEPEGKFNEWWSNTLEWCRQGVTQEKDNLQKLPAHIIARWLEIFNNNESIIIPNMDAIKNINQKEWEILSGQGIVRLIASPVFENNKLVAFVGVDNPRHCVNDDAQLRAMALFIENCYLSSQTLPHMRDMLDLRYQNILQATEVGLWIIRINKALGKYELYADENMKRILGIRGNITPEACYQHWYSRINDGYYNYVNLSLQDMIESRDIVQLQYTWTHPAKGDVLVRCTGVRVADVKEFVCLEGYHRIISNMKQVKFLPDTPYSEMFEYNEQKASVYFHTSRNFIAGESLKEERFPYCWLEQEIVHPHFADSFLQIFTKVKESSDIDGMEILLKNKMDEYAWFRIKTRHLGKEARDRNTILVLLDLANRERRMELEYQRLKDFYKASLAETIAYAEVDLESGKLLDIGGIWEKYAKEYKSSKEEFLKFISKKLKKVKEIKDTNSIWISLDQVDWDSLLHENIHTQRVSYRRPFGKNWRWVELVIHVFQDQISQNKFALFYLKDIDSIKQREIAQKEAASRDPLTQVLNRKAFEEKVRLYMKEEDRKEGVLILIDIDNFKEINDTYGHMAGDEALKYVTERLHRILKNSIIGRLGGDEFLVFLKEKISRKLLDENMEILFSSLKNRQDIPISCSAGIVFSAAKDFSYKKEIEKADKALYKSKQIGKGRYYYADNGILE